MKLIYIDRDPKFWINPHTVKDCQERIDQLKESLKDYTVITRYNILDLRIQFVSWKNYKALITHLQEDPTKKLFDYEKSIEKIKTIHDNFNPDMKIIVYTGASEKSASDEQIYQAGVSRIIRKSKIEQDILKIKPALEELIQNDL